MPSNYFQCKNIQTEEKRPYWLGKACERMVGDTLRRADWVRGEHSGKRLHVRIQKEQLEPTAPSLSTVFSSLRGQEVVCMWCATIKSLKKKNLLLKCQRLCAKQTLASCKVIQRMEGPSSKTHIHTGQTNDFQCPVSSGLNKVFWSH